MSIKDSKPHDAVESVLSRVKGEKVQEDPQLAAAKLNAEKEVVELDGRKKFFKLRDRWSWWIIGWITGILVFEVFVGVFILFGIYDGVQGFLKDVWLLRIIFTSAFLEIIGMGLVVVKFLYPKS